MEQPLRARTAGVTSAVTDGTSALGTVVAARDQYVLLRVPDCTTLLVQKKVGDLTNATSRSGWSGKIATLLASLSGRWRRPRALLASSLGVALVCLAVALVAASRHRPSNHASGDHDDEGANTVQQVGGGFLAGESRGVANSSSMLDDAPPYVPGDVNQGRSNQAARIQETPTAGENSAADAQARKSSAPCARIEQRIDRVPSQY